MLICGRSYIAPEVARKRPYDTRADVWALGVIMYEIMTLDLDHPHFYLEATEDEKKFIEEIENALRKRVYVFVISTLTI